MGEPMNAETLRALRFVRAEAERAGNDPWRAAAFDLVAELLEQRSAALGRTHAALLALNGWTMTRASLPPLALQEQVGAAGMDPSGAAALAEWRALEEVALAASKHMEACPWDARDVPELVDALANLDKKRT